MEVLNGVEALLEHFLREEPSWDLASLLFLLLVFFDVDLLVDFFLDWLELGEFCVVLSRCVISRIAFNYNRSLVVLKRNVIYRSRVDQ